MVSSNPSSEARYSIAAVSKLTGVSCHTLRVWERRYGFPEPQRTSCGHRRYAAEQVSLILQVTRRCGGGTPIARLVADARDGRLVAEPEACASPDRDPSILELIEALARADLASADAVYRRVSAELPPAEIADRYLTPALTESGERLFRRDFTLCQERLATMFLLRKLATVFDEVQRVNIRPVATVLALSVQGDRHEGGPLMLSLALELSGWRAIYLGADLKVAEIQRAITLWQPTAVGISLTLSRNIRKRFNELAALRGAPVFIGGRSVVNYQGLAKRSGLSVVLGPAVPNLPPYLAELKASARIEAAPTMASVGRHARSRLNSL